MEHAYTTSGGPLRRVNEAGDETSAYKYKMSNRTVRRRWIAATLVAACLGLISSVYAAPSSTITTLDPRTGVVTAREAATGRIFQFTVSDPALLRRLQPGQPVEGDFQALIVTIPSTTYRFRMLNVQSAAPGAASAGKPAAPGAAVHPGAMTPVPGTATPTTPATSPPCLSASTTSATFLRIDGIVGESQDVCHRGEIELMMLQISDPSAAGVSSPASLTVVKRLDSVSPRLFMIGAAGQHLPQVIVTLLTADTPPRLLTYKLRDVVVTSLMFQAGSETREQLGFAFSEVTLTSTALQTNVSVTPPPPPAPVDIFLKIPSIAGDSQDAAHPGEITGKTLTGTAQRIGATAASPGQFQIGDFFLVKGVDSSSAALFQARVSGNRLQQADITLRRRGGNDFLRYSLRDVVVKGFSQDTSTQAEQVQFGFGRIEIESWGGAPTSDQTKGYSKSSPALRR